MSVQQQLRGTGVALITPFTPNNTIDFDALGKVIESMISGGVEYLVSLGTTAETPVLTNPEKIAILEYTYEKTAGRVPVVVGIGGNDTADLIHDLTHFPLEKATAILSASPYYNKPSQEGIFQHYKMIAAASPKPILLYNVPGRTGRNMTAATTLRIANEVDNIIGIKEASGDMAQCMQILRDKPKGFLVVSGDDALVTRERQDEYAAQSHARAAAAAAAGTYDAELVAVGDVVRDDRPREGLTVERLARLRPAFRDGGTVTAGNSCGISDGAAAVALVDAATQERLGLPGLRVLATATCGVDPRRPGIGLVPAVRQAVSAAGIVIDELDVIEINEAFAGQVLACCDELGIDPARVCPQGGALALGHPWGASGAVLVVRLFTQLVLQGSGRYGLAAIAAGGGQGVALVVERCP